MLGRKKGRKIGPYQLRASVIKNRVFPHAQRINADLTIEDLAAIAGISRRTVIRMESGERMTRYTRRRVRDALTAVRAKRAATRR